MIVHEWGHLRWGVFDEYPTDIDRIAYPSISGSGTEATACSVNLAKEVRHQILLVFAVCALLSAGVLGLLIGVAMF